MKAFAFALIVFALQSALYVLLPTGFAVPDVVLLVALTASTRLEPTIGLTLGFGLGFLQDVLGAGVLGFHAAGVAAGVFISFFIRRFFSAETGLNHAAAILVAEIAKWMVFVVLDFWARSSLIHPETALVFVGELLGTLVLGPFVYWLATWGFGPVPQSDERLL
jgi:rod shape-determining protein MreD